MRKLDAHVHIYERINGYGYRGELRPVGDGMGRWANGDDHRLIPRSMGGVAFLAEDLISLMDRAGVEKAVILQGNLYGFHNEYISEAIRRHPQRLTGACSVDPFARKGRETLAHLLDGLGYRAAKFEFSDNCGLMSFHKPFAIDGELMMPYYRMLAERGATVAMDIGSLGMDSYQPEAIARIARAFPQLRIVVCHLLAHKPNEEEVLARELEGLCHPNLWFDLAALPWNVAPEAYPFDSARRYVKRAREIVGADRLLWGSDAPSVMLDVRYGQLGDYLIESGIFTASELEAVFYTNAAGVYQFKDERI